MLTTLTLGSDQLVGFSRQFCRDNAESVLSMDFLVCSVGVWDIEFWIILAPYYVPQKSCSCLSILFSLHYFEQKSGVVNADYVREVRPLLLVKLLEQFSYCYIYIWDVVYVHLHREYAGWEWDNKKSVEAMIFMNLLLWSSKHFLVEFWIIIIRANQLLLILCRILCDTLIQCEILGRLL